MINSRQDLKEYIRADRSRYQLRKPRILGWLLKDESYIVIRFLSTLRKLEYYTNKQRSVLDQFFYIYYTLKHRWLEHSSKIRLRPNVVGKGLYIPHCVGGIIINATSVGEYCTINTGVIIGNKHKADNKPTIGNNVELTIGCKIIGRITIGDHSIVAPNSVVIKDVAPYSIVSGIPAVTIKILKND